MPLHPATMKLLFLKRQKQTGDKEMAAALVSFVGETYWFSTNSQGGEKEQ